MRGVTKESNSNTFPSDFWVISNSMSQNSHNNRVHSTIGIGPASSQFLQFVELDQIRFLISVSGTQCHIIEPSNIYEAKLRMNPSSNPEIKQGDRLPYHPFGQIIATIRSRTGSFFTSCAVS